jgi:hypothetical protein
MLTIFYKILFLISEEQSMKKLTKLAIIGAMTFATVNFSPATDHVQDPNDAKKASSTPALLTQEESAELLRISNLFLSQLQKSCPGAIEESPTLEERINTFSQTMTRNSDAPLFEQMRAVLALQTALTTLYTSHTGKFISLFKELAKFITIQNSSFQSTVGKPEIKE